MQLKILAYLLLGLFAFSSVAIEGQDPTPRFMPPDFSVEEERVTYPSDLIEFFRDPFLEYLRQDSAVIAFSPFARFSSDEEFVGDFRFKSRGVFAEGDGKQLYLGDGGSLALLRTIYAGGGYGDVISGLYPVGLTLSGRYAYYRGHYEPTTWILTGRAEGHIPLGNNLISLQAEGARESWAQRPGPFPKSEPLDPERQYLANTIAGEAVFRCMPGEYTGFEVAASGTRTTRFQRDSWIRKYQVLSGTATLIYDSAPLRIGLGGVLHHTWEEQIYGPSISFDITSRNFFIKARLNSQAEVPSSWATLPSPRVVLPINSQYRIMPIALDATAQFQLKPGQLLHGRVSYENICGEPVIWEPLSEAPQVSMEEALRQSVHISMTNDFGHLKNTFSADLISYKVNGQQIPTEPTRILADTVRIDFGKGIGLWGAGVQRMGLPDIGEGGEDEFSLGAAYKFRQFGIYLGVQNILQEPLFDTTALEFSDRMRIWGGVSLDL